jgi:hypothetical protein
MHSNGGRGLVAEARSPDIDEPPRRGLGGSHASTIARGRGPIAREWVFCGCVVRLRRPPLAARTSLRRRAAKHSGVGACFDAPNVCIPKV